MAQNPRYHFGLGDDKGPAVLSILQANVGSPDYWRPLTRIGRPNFKRDIASIGKARPDMSLGRSRRMSQMSRYFFILTLLYTFFAKMILVLDHGWDHPKSLMFSVLPFFPQQSHYSTLGPGLRFSIPCTTSLCQKIVLPFHREMIEDDGQTPI